MKRMVLVLFVFLFSLQVHAGFNVSFSGNMSVPVGQTFGMDYSPGIQLSGGYTLFNKLELNLEGQRLWFQGSLNQTYSAVNARLRFYPLNFYLRPYLSVAVGKGQIKEEVFGDYIKSDLFIIHPQLGVIVPAGIVRDLFMDISIGYEHIDYVDFNHDFQLLRMNVGLKYFF